MLATGSRPASPARSPSAECRASTTVPEPAIEAALLALPHLGLEALDSGRLSLSIVFCRQRQTADVGGVAASESDPAAPRPCKPARDSR
jgi:hypothetical protein